MTLKSKNTPIVLGFVILIYVGFASMNGLSWSFAESMKIGKEGVALESPVLTLAFHLLVLILAYLLPSDWKHRAVYLRWHHPLPGCRVFTELCTKDSRISYESLVKLYGELPTSPSEQNALWYKIYKEKQADEIVLNSHGKWLLFRDIYAISIVLFLPSSAFTFWHSGITKGITFTIFYLTLIVSLWLCARNTGIRFTCNVLAR
jgi:hypothetical protein